MLVSIATQNLNAAAWFGEGYPSLSGRPQSPARGCVPGTSDWVGGAGPMQDLEQVTLAWFDTEDGKAYLARKAKEQDKVKRKSDQEKLTRKRRKKEGNLFPEVDGYETPSPAEDRERPFSPPARVPTPLPTT